MEAFKTPDLQAPRFRTNTYEVLNKDETISKLKVILNLLEINLKQ